MYEGIKEFSDAMTSNYVSLLQDIPEIKNKADFESTCEVSKDKNGKGCILFIVDKKRE